MRLLIALAAFSLFAANEISDTTGSNVKFQGANAYCDTLTEDTNTDWRMPTVDELVEQATDGNDVYLWTRSFSSENEPKFILMNLSNGQLATVNSADTNAAVRCVR